jgi:hypothetical protein
MDMVESGAKHNKIKPKDSNFLYTCCFELNDENN